MDFFKSVFSDDPDPALPKTTRGFDSDSHSGLDDDRQQKQEDEEADRANSSNPNPNTSGGGGGSWSFDGLVKTLTTKSESVLEVYRRDLKEFGSGLKKETAAFREAANRAVKELPQSIDDLGTSVWKSTAEIISHGKGSQLDHESDSSESQNLSNQSFSSNRYSRFDAQLRSIQTDTSTYCEEPDDLEDYNRWKLGFVLEDKLVEIAEVLQENGPVEGIFAKIVPSTVDRDTFWFRYFYKVHKLKQAEDARVNLVKRAISMDDEEDLSWDVDDDNFEADDDNYGANNDSAKVKHSENGEEGNKDLPYNASEVESSKDWQLENEDSLQIISNNQETSHMSQPDISRTLQEKHQNEEPQNRAPEDSGEDGCVAESGSEKAINDKMQDEGTSQSKNQNLALSSDEKMDMERRDKREEPLRDGEYSVTFGQPSVLEEEDLGWDEIEELGSIDDKKITVSGSPNKGELRRRLSAAAEEEDLSWDIDDDDDEPVKA